MRLRLLLSLLLVAAIWVVYFQVWQFEFINLDDQKFVSLHPRVSQGLNFANVVWSFSDFDMNWIPLTWLSLMLDTDLFGKWAGGFHLVNVLIHTCNAVLLFLLFSRMTSQVWQSFVVAALFAIHPLHVESVAWVNERKDVLSMFFGLLSMWTYVGDVRRPNSFGRALSLFWYLCSLMSKQTLVTLPCVLLLLDLWPLGRMGRLDQTTESGDGSTADRTSTQWLIIEKTPYFALAITFCAIAMFAQHHGNATASLDNFPVSIRFINAGVAYVLYLERAVFPRGLAIFYPHPGETLTVMDALVPGLLLLSVTVVCVATVRRWPFLFVGWFWYLGTLVPLIGLVQVGSQQIADRYTYFPLIGLYIAAVWLVSAVVPIGAVRRYALPACTAGVLLILMMVTFRQLSYWRDSQTLFAHAIEVAESSLAHRLFGSALIDKKDFAEGLVHLQIAVGMAHTDELAHFSLASGLQAAGRLREAAEEYRRTLSINESKVAAYNNLGLILQEERQFDQALRLFQRAVELDPEFPLAHRNLAGSLAGIGQFDQAIAHYERALEFDPKAVKIHASIGIVLRLQKQYDLAIERFRYVLKQLPDDCLTRLELARTLALQGNVEAARTEYQKLLERDPTSAVVQQELAELSNR